MKTQDKKEIREIFYECLREELLPKLYEILNLIDKINNKHLAKIS